LQRSRYAAHWGHWSANERKTYSRVYWHLHVKRKKWKVQKKKKNTEGEKNGK